jgi:hypothetical protein
VPPTPGPLHPRSRGVAALGLLAASVVVLLLVLVLVGWPRPGPHAEITLTPTADTYVGSDKPRTQHGYADVLRTDADHLLSLIHFDVPHDRRPVVAASLRLRSLSRNIAGGVLHRVDTEWDEVAVTWDSRPSLGTPVALVPPSREPGWVEVDVTRAVQPGQPLSLALSARGATMAAYASRESSGGGPTLRIRYR